jgi:hypothetical protein
MNFCKMINILTGGTVCLPGSWYRSFSRPPPPLHCVAKSSKSAHAVVGKWESFQKGDVIMKWFSFTNHPFKHIQRYRVSCLAFEATIIQTYKGIGQLSGIWDNHYSNTYLRQPLFKHIQRYWSAVWHLRQPLFKHIQSYWSAVWHLRQPLFKHIQRYWSAVWHLRQLLFKHIQWYWSASCLAFETTIIQTHTMVLVSNLEFDDSSEMMSFQNLSLKCNTFILIKRFSV